MRVLWLSGVNTGLYKIQNETGGWVGSLQMCVKRYAKDISLGVVIESKDKLFKENIDGFTYYPIDSKDSLKHRLQRKLNDKYYWEIIRPKVLKAIEDFKPDIIQCFGSEVPYGQIVEYVNIPVVIHMQGFLNVYSKSGKMSISLHDIFKYKNYNPFACLRYWFRSSKDIYKDQIEQKIMQENKYFMGRTEWDKNLVKYYSNNANYYYCSEAIREGIYNSQETWTYKSRKKMIIISISSGSILKGAGLILQTAKILKSFNFDFEWRVAGDKNCFKIFEKKYGLKHGNLGINSIGYLTSDEVKRELLDADAYVHTAIIDNSPNSLCEAQLIGCPVITSFVGGIPQLVTDGETGLFYPYNEPYALAFLIMNLYKNKKLSEHLSSNEIGIATERHNPEKIAMFLQKNYKDIIEDYVIHTK